MKAYDFKARGLADIASIGAFQLACIAFSGLALAQPVLLSGEALRDAVSGGTVEIDTPIGTTVPVKVGTDGSLNGEAGSVAFILGSSHDQGRWWIENGQLCQRWSTWFHGDKRCLRIVRDGNRIAWERDDGETGTATLYPKPPAVAVVAAEGPRSSLGGPPPVPDVAATELQPQPVTATAPARIEAPPAPVRKTPVRAILPLKRPAQKPAAGASFWVSGVAANDVLNVRQGPSADATVLGSIPPQSRGVRIAGGCAGLWCQVQFEKLRGWVNRSYLVFEVPALASATVRAAGAQPVNAKISGK